MNSSGLFYEKCLKRNCLMKDTQYKIHNVVKYQLEALIR